MDPADNGDGSGDPGKADRLSPAEYLGCVPGPVGTPVVDFWMELSRHWKSAGSPNAGEMAAKFRALYADGRGRSPVLIPAVRALVPTMTPLLSGESIKKNWQHANTPGWRPRHPGQLLRRFAWPWTYVLVGADESPHQVQIRRDALVRIQTLFEAAYVVPETRPSGVMVNGIAQDSAVARVLRAAQVVLSPPLMPTEHGERIAAREALASLTANGVWATVAIVRAVRKGSQTWWGAPNAEWSTIRDDALQEFYLIRHHGGWRSTPDVPHRRRSGGLDG